MNYVETIEEKEWETKNKKKKSWHMKENHEANKGSERTVYLMCKDWRVGCPLLRTITISCFP